MHTSTNGSANRHRIRKPRRVSWDTVAAVEKILCLKLTLNGRRWMRRALVHKSMHQGKVRTWSKLLENSGDKSLGSAVSILLLRTGSEGLKYYHEAHSLLITNALWSRIAIRMKLVQFMVVPAAVLDYDPAAPPKEFADIMEVILTVVALEEGCEQDARDLIRRLLQPELSLPLRELVARYHKSPRTIGDLPYSSAAFNGGNGHANNRLSGAAIPLEIASIIEAAKVRGQEALSQLFRTRRTPGSIGRHRESPRAVLNRALCEIGLSQPDVRVAHKGRRVEVHVESGAWSLAKLRGKNEERITRRALVAAVKQLRQVLVPEVSSH